ncbi:MAG TPA: hypothetical protein VGZ29_07080 [Terriglobia bacterium]|nr:hypothetical protein [Terriglobia bacterium]
MPEDLQTGQFQGYPPQARQLAVSNIVLLRQLPPVFAPLLLKELIAYDWKFPAERQDLERQLAYLRSLPPAEFERQLEGFSRIKISPELQNRDWVGQPGRFGEDLAAYLWATHQIDAFRTASEAYVQKLDAARPREPLPIPRLGIVVVGQGVSETRYRLLRKMRKQGVYFSQVKTEDGVRVLLDAVAARARAHPIPYAHWYIDGGMLEPVPQEVAAVSYGTLEPVRTALLARMQRAIQSGIGGPEALRTMLAQLRPEDLGMSGAASEAVLNRFQISVLTEGSGTQIFSTTFVQWTAREAWRRAQPLTLFARYAPRQRQRPMNELIADHGDQHPVPDPEGSLIDADMGAYYTWLNQQRLPGAGEASFLVWFEGHQQAVAISPTLPRGTESSTPIDLKGLIGQIT